MDVRIYHAVKKDNDTTHTLSLSHSRFLCPPLFLSLALYLFGLSITRGRATLREVRRRPGDVKAR